MFTRLLAHVLPILSTGVAQNAPQPNSTCDLSLLSGPGYVSEIFEQYNLSHDALGATVFSLLYGSPLISYNDTGLSKNVNQLSSTNTTDTAATNAPRPNVDTIYQKASLDLSQDDLVLTVPPFQPDRFYSFDFFDPFQSNYYSFGSVNNATPGDYLLRPSLYTGNSGLSPTNCSSNYSACIDSATLNGRLLNRVEVKNHTTDEPYIDAYLQQVKLTTLPRHDSTPLGSPLNATQFQDLPSSPPEDVLTLTAILASRNPPQDVSLAATIPQVLSCAGINITSHSYTPIPTVNLTEAYTIFNDTLATYAHLPGTFQDLGSGWNMLNASLVGSWANGTAIVTRSFAQTIGNLWNVASQAIYAGPVKQTFALPEDKALLFTFQGGKPPLDGDVFWSLTIYGPQGGLIANPADIYAVGSTGNLTYSDGEKVYNAENCTKEEGEPFELLVQSVDQPPPGNWSGNWLPSPAGGAEFSLAMRLYAEEAACVDGGYEYPRYEIVDAVVG